jgi:hypothetical protein
MSDMLVNAIVLTIVILLVLVPVTLYKLSRGENKKELGLVWLLIFAFSLIAFPTMLWMEHRDGIVPSTQDVAAPSKDWRAVDNSNHAYYFLRDRVKDRLKAPATAEFPGVFAGVLDHTKPIGDHRYQISSYVDSQNSFGVSIRTRFHGEVEQVSEHGWRLVSLTLEQQ